MMNTLSLNQVLLDGTILSLLTGIVVIASLRYNARLWLQDYPKPIREKVPPLNTVERRERRIVAVVMLATLIGPLVYYAFQLRANPELTFGTAYLHFFLVLLIFNLFDAVVIDLVYLTWMTPKYVILPGSEGMEYLFHDYRMHFVNFLKGIVFCIVFSLPFAALATF
jgi:hypothetical protein